MIPSISGTITDRALINRANAQRSTGPKTEEGKQRSSLNALRHGLTGQTIILNLNAEPDPVQDALSIVRALDSHTRALANLSLHGQRLSRQFEKTHALLKQIQSERIPNDEYDLREAADLVYMHELKGKSYDPAEDGFVFSDEEIQAAIHRRDRDVRAGNAAAYIAKLRRR